MIDHIIGSGYHGHRGHEVEILTVKVCCLLSEDHYQQECPGLYQHHLTQNLQKEVYYPNLHVIDICKSSAILHI